MRVGLGRIGVVGHAPDDEGALAEHLQEGNLAESRGRHALLLHLRRDEGGKKDVSSREGARGKNNPGRWVSYSRRLARWRTVVGRYGLA